MSVQTDFVTLLTPTFGAAVYPLFAPNDPSSVYAVYQVISSVEQLTLGANGGQDNWINTRLQCDIYAPTYAEAQSKATAVRTALKTWATTNVVRLSMDFYDPDTRDYRVMIEISTWHN